MRKFAGHFPGWHKRYGLEQIVEEMVGAVADQHRASA
jgi:hypothetical protein